jgi:hypothetical protein
MNNYSIKITSASTSRVESWYWFGQMQNGLKVLFNHSKYASDANLLMDDKNQVVGGYSFIYNQFNKLEVSQQDV